MVNRRTSHHATELNYFHIITQGFQFLLDLAEINSRILALKTLELRLLGTIHKLRIGRNDEAIQDITYLARKNKATVLSLEQKMTL